MLNVPLQVAGVLCTLGVCHGFAEALSVSNVVSLGTDCQPGRWGTAFAAAPPASISGQRRRWVSGCVHGRMGEQLVMSESLSGTAHWRPKIGKVLRRDERTLMWASTMSGPFTVSALFVHVCVLCVAAMTVTARNSCDLATRCKNACS